MWIISPFFKVNKNTKTAKRSTSWYRSDFHPRSTGKSLQAFRRASVEEHSGPAWRIHRRGQERMRSSITMSRQVTAVACPWMAVAADMRKWRDLRVLPETEPTGFVARCRRTREKHYSGRLPGFSRELTSRGRCHLLKEGRLEEEQIWKRTDAEDVD